MTDSSVIAMLLFVAACAGYRPGSLEPEGSGMTATVGCLDLAVEPVADSLAEGPVARIRFANRCDAAVTVDLGAIVATVRYRDGHEGAMQVYDPEGTIRPGLLDARNRAWEMFEYHPRDAADRERIAEKLCLDVARVDRQEPSPFPMVMCVEIEPTYWTSEEAQ